MWGSRAEVAGDAQALGPPRIWACGFPPSGSECIFAHGSCLLGFWLPPLGHLSPQLVALADLPLPPSLEAMRAWWTAGSAAG